MIASDQALQSEPWIHLQAALLNSSAHYKSMSELLSQAWVQAVLTTSMIASDQALQS